LVEQAGEYTAGATLPRGFVVRVAAVHMRNTHRDVRASPRNRMVSPFIGRKS
jgi:hypothetical protein